MSFFFSFRNHLHGFVYFFSVFQDSKRNTGSILFDDSATENPHENWRNKNLDVAKPFKSRRRQSSILEPSKPCFRLPVFKNANLWKKKKTNRPEITHNTCSFDTIFQLYATCYVDSPSFKELADKNTSSDFIKLLIDFCGWKNMEDLLQQRNELLHKTFNDKVTINRKILELDCYMSVIDMFIGLAKKNEILYSVIENRRCPVCSHHQCIKKTSLPISCRDLDLSQIDRSLRFKERQIDCEKCDVEMKMEINRSISPVCIIDLDGMMDPHIKIDRIQKSLSVQGEEYKFCGFIETCGYHFIAHALRSDGKWYSYDDMHPSVAKVTRESSLLHPVLLMYCELNEFFRIDAL